MNKVKFRGLELDVQFARYGNGRVAITLIDMNGEHGPEPYCVASVNIPAAQCPDNHTFIKDWSENEGVQKALVDAGIISLTGVIVPTGFVSSHLAEILVPIK